MRPKAVALGCFLAVCVAGSAVWAGEPAAEKSKFEKLSKEIGELLNFTFDGDALVLDRGHWETSPAGAAEKPRPGPRVGVRVNVGGLGQQSGVDRIFRKLGTAAGGGGFGMTASNNYRTQRFSGRGFSAELKVSGGRVHVALREEAGPGNELSVIDGAKGGLRLLFTNSRGDVLVLIQTAAGRFTVAHVTAEKTFTRAGATFASFYRGNCAYVDETLFPFLRRIGVRLFPGRFSPKVLQAVCSRLRPFSEQERLDFQKLLREMDDQNFDVRERATKALSEKFARYAPLIEQASGKPPSEEVRMRLGKVLAGQRDQTEVNDVIAALNLLNDAEYLKQLLGKVKGADRAAVAERLKQLATDSTKQ